MLMRYACFPAILAGLAGVAAFAQQDLTPAEILEKVSSTYQNPQQYYFKAVESDSGAKPWEITIAAERPDKALIEAKGNGLCAEMAAAMAVKEPCPQPVAGVGEHDVILVDGHATWAYFSGLNQYIHRLGGVVHEDPGNLKSDVKPGTTVDLVTHIDDLFFKRYRTFTKVADQAKLLRTEPISFSGREVRCYVLRIDVDQKGRPSNRSFYTWWVSEDRFLVLREDIEARHSSSSTVFTRASIDEPLDPGLFVFTPPPGAREMAEELK